MELQELITTAIMKGGDARVSEAELGKLPEEKKKAKAASEEDGEAETH